MRIGGEGAGISPVFGDSRFGCGCPDVAWLSDIPDGAHGVARPTLPDGLAGASPYLADGAHRVARPTLPDGGGDA